VLLGQFCGSFDQVSVITITTITTTTTIIHLPYFTTFQLFSKQFDLTGQHFLFTVLPTTF
jgi:hypothetical protein